MVWECAGVRMPWGHPSAGHAQTSYQPLRRCCLWGSAATHIHCVRHKARAFKCHGSLLSSLFCPFGHAQGRGSGWRTPRVGWRDGSGVCLRSIQRVISLCSCPLGCWLIETSIAVGFPGWRSAEISSGAIGVDLRSAFVHQVFADHEAIEGLSTVLIEMVHLAGGSWCARHMATSAAAAAMLLA